MILLVNLLYLFYIEVIIMKNSEVLSNTKINFPINLKKLSLIERLKKYFKKNVFQLYKLLYLRFI